MTKLKEFFKEDMWIRGASARDKFGEEVYVGDPSAVYFSLGGAFMKCYAGETNKDIVENFPVLKQAMLDHLKDRGRVIKNASILKFSDAKKTKWADIQDVIERSGL